MFDQWKCVPVTPDSRQVVYGACELQGYDEKGFCRTDSEAWPDHVAKAEKVYAAMVKYAPEAATKGASGQESHAASRQALQQVGARLETACEALACLESACRMLTERTAGLAADQAPHLAELNRARDFARDTLAAISPTVPLEPSPFLRKYLSDLTHPAARDVVKTPAQNLTLVCHACGVDRYKDDCKGDRSRCAMTAIAHQA